MRGPRSEIPLCKYGNCCTNFQAGAIEKPAGISRLQWAFGLGLAFRLGGYGSPPAATAVLVTYPPLLVILRVGGDDDGLGLAIRDAGRLTPRHLHHQLERLDWCRMPLMRMSSGVITTWSYSTFGTATVAMGASATIASPAITLFEFSRIYL